MENIQLYQGDCLEIMDKLIEKGVKVDAIITDPPYGTTGKTVCKWDIIIPFDEMWKRLNKLVKPNGAIVLFGSEPFSSALRMSNIKNYKYDWIWDKKKPSNFPLAKKQPMKYHENIIVFNKHNYYPIMVKVEGRKAKKGVNKDARVFNKGLDNPEYLDKIYTDKYPSSILEFSNADQRNRFHPTQKPVKLLEYLIKTYTNENELVLDFTMGSGSTGVACLNTNRKFIGIELDKKYFEIAKERIEEAKNNKVNIDEIE